jgi:hypothetical protein
MMRSALQAAKAASRLPPHQVGASRFMSKEIKFGVEGRAAMLRGVNILADAVQVSRSNWKGIEGFHFCVL